MNARVIAGIVIMIAVVAGIAMVTLSIHNTNQTPSINTTSYNNNPTTIAGTSNQTSVNSTKVLFANTQYAPYAYLIYPGQLSSQAQAAMSGFNMSTTTLQNDSTEITLSVTGTNQQQVLTLKPGYKLYIIETSFGDDSFHFDSSLGDDGFVVVDSNGYVV